MLKKVIMPTLGLDMESATIERWLKAEGDRVEQGESIVLVETDKATTEIESPESGILKQIIHGPGATVPVTQTIAWIDDGKPGKEPAEASAPTKPAVAPATATRGAATGGAPATFAASSSASLAAPIAQHGKLRASPAARHLAAELGVDLSQVIGSGPGGRVQGEDVRAFTQRRQSATAPAVPSTTSKEHTAEASGPLAHPSAAASQSSAVSPQPPTTASPKAATTSEAATTAAAQRSPQPSRTGGASGLPGRLVPLSRKRRITAERMALSSRTVARLTMNLEVDATEMVQLKARLRSSYEQRGLRLSYNDLLVKVVAVALKEHPYLNSQWTDDGVYLVEPVNVGMAVAVEDGLVVPILHDADQKRLEEITAELSALVSRARENRLTRDDITGGTFTITSLGMYGIDSFTPIVNPPEAAILGVGQISEKPVGREGQIVLRPIMTLSLSFDHRIVDGAPAAEFLRRVKQLLEEPYMLL